MNEREKKTRADNIRQEIDLRLDGLLGDLGRTLGDMIDRLDGGAGEVRKTRSFDTNRGPVRAEAGIRIRAGGLDVSGGPDAQDPAAPDKPVHHRGAPRASRPSPVRPVDATIHQDATLWTLTADLPGATASDVSLSEDGGALVIVAEARGRRYEGRFDLPRGVSAGDVGMSLRNGILDLTAHLSTEGQP